MIGGDRAGLARRFAAGLVDGALGLLLAMLLAGSSGHYFAERAVDTFAIGSPGTIWKGPVPLVLGVLGTVGYGIPLALALVLLSEPLTGRTPGKMLMRLIVTGEEGGDVSPGALWIRAAVKTGPLFGFAVGLAVGAWLLAALSFGAGVLVLGACLPVLGGSMTGHDSVAGTKVGAKPALPTARDD